MATYTGFYYYQKFRINVIDADTNRPIEDELQLEYITGGAPTIYKQFKLMIGGTTEWEVSSLYKIGEKMPTYTIKIFSDCLEALGYDPNSVKGNTATAILNPATGVPSYPTLMNIYISKKK